MEDRIQIRISKELKEKFNQLTKSEGTDPSTKIRTWIAEYVAENEKKLSDDSAIIDKLYNNGYTIQEKLGRAKIKPKVWELLNHINSDLNKFVEEVITLHIELNLPIPNEILDCRENVFYAQAFVMGMLGDKRLDES